ncbi:hypothetical protein FRB96_003976 [Tulasnella sp. 330]|nr:hypothetical protein FRB96_003976 [Tulasnella sp. 330]KAG8888873.1 hypothetical protein FRB98_006538 [Tulasnella sp. 332]
MCGTVNYIYKCNHTHRAREACSHAAGGYACSGRMAEKHLALPDPCPGCTPAYQKWVALQAAGNEKRRVVNEQEESRRLNEWYRATLFEPTAN